MIQYARNRTLLISIHPQYIDAILSGIKQIELRKCRPDLISGDIVLMYATTPKKELVGYFTVSELIEGNPKLIWRKYGRKSGISLEKFEQYYDGKQTGFGILIEQVEQFETPISLQKLRGIFPRFQPPQGYRYFNNHDLKKIVRTIS